MNFFNKDSLANSWFKKQVDAWNPPDYYSISAHGSLSIITGPDGKQMSPQALADLIRQDPNWNNQPVFLDACSTGMGENSFAQRLSDEQGVIVKAPTDDVCYGWTYRGRKVLNGGKDETYKHHYSK